MPLRSAIQSTTNLMKFQQITIKSPLNPQVLCENWCHVQSPDPWIFTLAKESNSPHASVSIQHRFLRMWSRGFRASRRSTGKVCKVMGFGLLEIVWLFFWFGGRTCKFQAHQIDFFQLPMDTPYLADLELIHMELMKHWGPRKVEEEIVSIGWGVKPRTKWSGGFLSPRSCDFFKSGKWINDPVSKWISIHLVSLLDLSCSKTISIINVNLSQRFTPSAGYFLKIYGYHLPASQGVCSPLKHREFFGRCRGTLLASSSSVTILHVLPREPALTGGYRQASTPFGELSSGDNWWLSAKIGYMN